MNKTNLEIAKECGATYPTINGVEFEVEQLDSYTYIICAEKDAEILRFARLCEAKDADNKLLRALHQKFVTANETLVKQLSESQAQIAMLTERIKQIRRKNDNGEYEFCLLETDLNAALSAASETVAAWRAKETEPLRREVAMLLAWVKLSADGGYWTGLDEVEEAAKNLLEKRQATALAYEREVENRGAVKALGEANSLFIKWYVSEREVRLVCSSVDNRDKLVSMLIGVNICAANKGEVK